jgi:uncharacterized protein YqeY
MILDRVNDHLKRSMKDKDSFKTSVLREIKDSLSKLEGDIQEKDEIKAIQKLADEKRESIEYYQKYNKSEALNNAERELEIILSYLPEQLSEDEVRNIVDDIISDLNVTQLKDMKKVMAEAENRIGNKCDNKTIANIAKDILGTQ